MLSVLGGFTFGQAAIATTVAVGGGHARRALGHRQSLVASAGYALVPRSRRAQELGVGRHVFRLGLGLSVRLGQ